MSTREQLAEVIRDGVGVWRAPLEAADAILGALAPQQAALDAVLAIAVRLEASNQCEDREIAEDIRAAVNDALEADK